MGRNYLFECSRCGYRARVAGGVSDGAWFIVQTVRCHQCKELHDAVVELKLAVPSLNLGKWKSTLRSRRQLLELAGFKQTPAFKTLVDRLPPGGAKQYRWIKFSAACPVSARHRVEQWKSPGKCPKCDWFLESSALPFRTWD